METFLSSCSKEGLEQKRLNFLRNNPQIMSIRSVINQIGDRWYCHIFYQTLEEKYDQQ